MEDKIFDLLEKLYIEVQEVKSNMATKDELSEAKKELKHDIIRLEEKMDKNHKALYDGYWLTYEKLEALETKVDEHDVEIKIMRGVQ